MYSHAKPNWKLFLALPATKEMVSLFMVIPSSSEKARSLSAMVALSTGLVPFSTMVARFLSTVNP